MRGGQNKKPTVMKVLEGTYRADRATENEPMPDPIKIPPLMPEGLNPLAQKEWEKMTLELTKIGMLTEIDTSQLAAYCQEIGSYWECEAVRKLGTQQENKEKFEMAQKHLKAAKDLAIQFGFTPAARSRINLPKKEEISELDRL